MNSFKQLYRTVSLIRNVYCNNNTTFRTLTTASTKGSLQIQSQPSIVPNDVELDKLFKRVELEMRGIDPAVLLSYSWFCIAAASHLGIEVTKSWTLRKAEKERLTLLKCVHIFKKHKVQYEMRTYFRFVHLQRLTGSTCDTYLEYIERNLPEGCALKVTKVECQNLPEHIKTPIKE